MTHTLRGSHLALVAALAVGLSCSPVWAQAGQNGSRSSNALSSAAANPASAANPNQRAVALMTTFNQDQIAGATAVASKTQSASVGDFATAAKAAHQTSESDLQGIASNQHLTLEQDHHMHAMAEHFLDHLQKMPEARANGVFMRHEAHAHAKMIRRMTRLESKVTDPTLRKYITDKYIPMLRKHEHQAHEVLAKLGGPASSQPASKAEPPHQHRPYDLPPYAQNGTAQNRQKPQQTTPTTNPQAPARAAANPGRQAGQHTMPTTGSPLGLLIVAGAALTGLGIGTKRRKK